MQSQTRYTIQLGSTVWGLTWRDDCRAQPPAYRCGVQTAAQPPQALDLWLPQPDFGAITSSIPTHNPLLQFFAVLASIDQDAIFASYRPSLC